MMMTKGKRIYVLDTNVLIALINGEPTAGAVTHQLGELHASGSLCGSGAVYAELLAGRDVTPAYLTDLFERTSVILDAAADEMVWTTAGLAYGAYAGRRHASGGQLPRRILADFLIGAHARLRADQLFTLDPRRYQQAFPELRVLDTTS